MRIIHLISLSCCYPHHFWIANVHRTNPDQRLPQTPTDDELAVFLRDFDAPASSQQVQDQDNSGQTLLTEELLDQQIPGLADPIPPVFNQELFDQQVPLQQLPIQQPFVGQIAVQGMPGPMWPQQPVPDQSLLGSVRIQPRLMQQQGQMPGPQSLAPGMARGVAPCYTPALIGAPPNALPPVEVGPCGLLKGDSCTLRTCWKLNPGYQMCGRCNQPCEVARNRNSACYFHRSKLSPP